MQAGRPAAGATMARAGPQAGLGRAIDPGGALLPLPDPGRPATGGHGARFPAS